MSSDTQQTERLQKESRRQQMLRAMGIQPLYLKPSWLPAQQAEAPPRSDFTAVPAEEAPTEVVTPVSSLSWDELQLRVRDCQLCELSLGRTQTVFGVGNPQAEMLIVGEAPGAEEDRQGEPFVGRAGKLLDAMLLAIGLRREQIYIANVLKCRPPNNRDPHTSEIVCCDPYLQRQIELIQPKLILALGRIAAHHLLVSEESIGALRQKTHHYNGIPLVVSYHPAYLLRNPLGKRKSWEDLLKIKKLLNLS